MAETKLVTLDPGHFHAALIQKEMYPGISNRVAVHAPLGPDLLAHLSRIAQFNARAVNPTAWELDVHCSPGFLQEMLAAHDGDVVVLAGRNRKKIDYISRSVEGGFHVLADKPWIIHSRDLERLERVLDLAETTGLAAYDIMTERYEITSILQRELVNDPDVFGDIVPGGAGEPGVRMVSVHHIMKLVAGTPLVRPAWFFDIAEQGEALSDVGTHLVDLAQWTLSPGRSLDYRAEIEVLGAERWPTELTPAQYQQVTGEPGYPAFLAPYVEGDRLLYYGNNRVHYTLRGVHVTLEALWKYETAEGGGDTHYAMYRGTSSSIEVRQGREENYRPELYVVPSNAGVEEALAARVAALQTAWPGVAIEKRPGEFLIAIPDQYRVGHEAHFAQVARQFFRYLRGDEPLPVWEKAGMLAKYYVTTRGVELSRE